MRKIYKYCVTIVWDDNKVERHYYKTREKALFIENGYKKAFGCQIVFSCVYGV